MFKVDSEIKQKIEEMQDMKHDMQNVLYQSREELLSLY